MSILKFVPYRYISICEYKFHEFPEFYGFYEFYELHYVDMYKVYIGNHIINYCMCTVQKCIYMELSIHG